MIWSRLSRSAKSVVPKARKPIFERSVLHRDRSGNQLARVFKLARQPVHHLQVLVRLLGVARRIVVSRAAREVRRLGMIGARQRAPADGVAVHIAVAREAAQPFEVFRGQHLAAIQRLVRIGERLRHPVVHAQVEIAEHKHRRLQPLGQIERRVAELEALLHRARQQNNVLGVAVREERRSKADRPAEVRVGMPVEGPVRCTSKITPGISA